MKTTKQLLWASVLLAGGLQAQQMPRAFSLADWVWVVVGPDWTERKNEDPPPPNLLAASAPHLIFGDILALENRKRLAVLKVALSENAFLGLTAPQLDSTMHANSGQGLANHLFHFFFPPPRQCLAAAKAALEEARQAEVVRLSRLEAKERVPRAVSATRRCEFSSSPQDFYAAQVSSALTLDATGKAAGALRFLYPPPMEEVEIAGRTFFIFEAQGQDTVERAQLDMYNLPEDLRGSRAHLFWAIGAESPFPFFPDPLRKNVPIIHVSFATLSTTGTAQPQFREILQSLRWAAP